ncbi:MAG TPA: hypothetical protein VLQ90_11345 [Pyrinomonadaceae bacterium]|nr:hypothetical protein [Pyrinomonadaceae bacterium]
MKWMECRATRREIDEGSEQLSAQTLRHVASCAACLAFQNERSRLHELLTSLEPVTAPADFDFRLRARIAAQTEKLGPRSFFNGFALSTPAMAVAALVIVALGGSIVWIEQRGAKQAPTVAVNSSSQVKAGNSKTADNLPPSQQVNESDSTTTTKNTGTNADASIYVVQGRKPQPRDPGQPDRRSSRDLSASPAPSIKHGQNPGAVYVSAPVKPMVFSLEDDHGATRRISLPPVSFGSQRLLESRVVPVSSKNDRVW